MQPIKLRCTGHTDMTTPSKVIHEKIAHLVVVIEITRKNIYELNAAVAPSIYV